MEKRVKIRKTVFGGAIARICCLALCLCLGLSISMTAQAASGKKSDAGYDGSSRRGRKNGDAAGG